ncbi:hypothetical protein V2J09_020076 [Rumex salicifolius]
MSHSNFKPEIYWRRLYTGYNHKAKSLKDEDSWELLKKICLSVGNTSDIGTDMEVLGKQMAKHCNVESGSSSQDNPSISQVLELSFDDLPYYLKPCFLHLGNFPEDYEIPTKTLYHMWAIEGIVAQPAYTTAGEVSVEAVAENCLKELANRCLVQLDSTGKVGKIKSCRLHDLIRDMCIEKSNEESFLKVIQHGYLEKESSNNNSSSSQMTKRFRRLVVYMHKSSDSLQDLISELQNHHVRSLLFFPAGQVPRKLTWTQRKVSETLKLVRILHFDNVCIRSLPDEIGDLIHLRYLSLKETRVRMLPSSVGKLKYLQILDLRVCECIVVMIPNVLWKLERLKHLYLPNNWLRSDFAGMIADQCLSVKKKLRLRGLIQLETRDNLRLGECRVVDLWRLPKLCKLSLADYTVTESELKCLHSFLEFSSNRAGLLKKPLSLTLDGDMISKEPSILSSNSQVQFHKLHISGKILLRLRYARIFPQDLKQLTLNESELKDDPMPTLERLPHLTELTLGQKTFLGTTMVFTLGNFPQLAILGLVQLPNLQEWMVEEGAMPNLKNLYIYSCVKLEIPNKLPKEVKIECRPCLTGCDKYGSCCYMTQQAPAAS